MKKTTALLIIAMLIAMPVASAEQPRCQLTIRLDVVQIKMLPNEEYGLKAGQNITGYFQYSNYYENGTVIADPFDIHNASRRIVQYVVNETVDPIASFSYVEQNDVPILRNITIVATFVIVENTTKAIYPGFNITVPADINKDQLCIGSEIETHYSCHRTFHFDYWEITFLAFALITDLLGSSRAEFPWWLYAVIGIALFIFVMIIFEVFYKNPEVEVYRYDGFIQRRSKK